jgi:hypothetical protein
MKRRVKAPSPAFAVSLIALFVALGGTTYAATKLPRDSVGTKQLRNSAVTSAKIRNAAVTGAKLNLAGVVVPNAVHATNADRLGGSPPSTYLSHCPSGLKRAPGTDLCYEVAERPRASWTDALTACTLAGLRLPDPAELAQIFNDQGAVQDYQWTSNLDSGGSGGIPTSEVAVALAQNASRQIYPVSLAYNETASSRCVTDASS